MMTMGRQRAVRQRVGLLIALGLGCGSAACEREGAVREATNESVRLPVTAPFEQRLEAAFAQLEAGAVPVIVAVAHGDEELVVREFGALRDDGIAPSTAQVDLNSVTKTVTGVMAAKLVEQGKLRFDDTLASVFPEVPDDKAAITLHQLLTHTAGFREALGDDAEPIGKQQFLQRAFASKLKAKPGRVYRYSNVGYGVVAAIIEQRSGKSYERFLREEVIHDLGLASTGYASVYDRARSLRSARGEPIDVASWGGAEPFWNLIGNGGLVSTVVDMLHFRRAVAAGRVISAPTLALVQTAHVAEDRAGTSFYGYGEVVQDVEGIGRVYWHDGGNDVFSAQWADYSDQGDVIFTAGADSRKGDAFEAMAVMATYLYGYEQ